MDTFLQSGPLCPAHVSPPLSLPGAIAHKEFWVPMSHLGPHSTDLARYPETLSPFASSSGLQSVLVSLQSLLPQIPGSDRIPHLFGTVLSVTNTPLQKLYHPLTRHRRGQPRNFLQTQNKPLFYRIPNPWSWIWY